jgi:Fur family ferric uptake transcriptional regulator
MERNTRQRAAILQAIQEADRPLTPQEILEGARRHLPKLGLATVYRAIRGLTEDGLLAAVPVPGEPDRYEAAGKPHHHHFYCNACARVFEMHGCPGPLSRLAPAGFEVDGHEVLLYGRCETCAKKKRSVRARARTS